MPYCGRLPVTSVPLTVYVTFFWTDATPAPTRTYGSIFAEAGNRKRMPPMPNVVGCSAL